MKNIFNLENIFDDKNIKFKNNVIYIDDIAIGIIQPSALFGHSDQNYYVSGSKGILSVNKKSTKEEIIDILIRSGCISFSSCKNIINETLKILKSPEMSRTSSYLLSVTKNCDHFLDVIDTIKNKNVAIIGCGGIGSISAMALAGSGITNITLIDGDIIEDSNLNRQFFWTKNDIGEKKVSILHREIKKRYPNCNCQHHNSMLDVNKILKFIKKFDLVILSADEPVGINETIETMIQNSNIKTSIVNAGYLGTSLSISLYNKDNRFVKNEKENIKWIRQNGFVAPSYGPCNIELAGVISSLAIFELANLNTANNFKMVWDSSVYPRKHYFKESNGE